jgi:hypothetical protein
MVYALTRDRDLVLHPEVGEALGRLRPVVDRVRTSDATEACVAAAADIVHLVSSFRVT